MANSAEIYHDRYTGQSTGAMAPVSHSTWARCKDRLINGLALANGPITFVTANIFSLGF